MRRQDQPPQTQLRLGTELTILTGAQVWCGHGVLAHDLVEISALAATTTLHRAEPTAADRGIHPSLTVAALFQLEGASHISLRPMPPLLG